MTQKQPRQITLLDDVCEALGNDAAFSLISLYRGLCHLKALVNAQPLRQVQPYNRASGAGDTRTPNTTWGSARKSHK